MATDLVPFGKHKGQPVIALAQDRDYCDWLLQQSWFMQRFPELHTIVVNNFGEPTETPEHNRLQLRFLDPVFVAKCSRVILDAFKPDNVDTAGWFLPMPTPEFELEGIDVTWRIRRWDCKPKEEVQKEHTVLRDLYKQDAYVIANALGGRCLRDDLTIEWDYRDYGGFPWCTGGESEHCQEVRDAVRVLRDLEENQRETERDADSDCRGGYEDRQRLQEQIKQRFSGRLQEAQRVLGLARVARQHAIEEAMAVLDARWAEYKPFFTNRITTRVICPTPLPCYMHDECGFAIECKPSLGDDYPAVLRFLRSLIGKYDHVINRCHKAIVIDQFSAQGGTLEQVKTFFRQAHILLLTAEEIEATEPLNNCEFAHFATCNANGWLNEKTQTS